MLSTTLDAKDEFYENLASTIRNIPSTKQLVLLGNFNARVGADNDLWPSCLGPFGVGKMNENGQWLLELCVFHNLCITNSFFKTKPQHKVSWRHLQSKHWHQLDLILFRCATIKNILHTHSYHSVDCDTDHSLVCCKIRLQPKKLHHAKKPGIPHINVSKMTQPDLMEQFAETFEEEYDWYKAKSSEMTPIIEGKHAALTEYKWSPTKWNLQTLRAARSKVQCITRCCTNEYWTKHSGDDPDGHCNGQHQMDVWWHQEGTGTNAEQDGSPQICHCGSHHRPRASRWRDRWNTIPTSTPERTLWLPQPWVQSSACQSWKSSMQSQPWMSSARSLTIWPQARHQAATVFLQTSSSTARPPYCTPCMKSSASAGERELCCKTWEMPRSLPCTRNKGERSDCNNYRGISLLSIIGKVYAQVLLICLQKLGWVHLPRITVWLPSWKVYGRHGVLPPSTPREVQRVAEAPVHCIHWPHQGLQPCQQRWPLQGSL